MNLGYIEITPRLTSSRKLPKQRGVSLSTAGDVRGARLSPGFGADRHVESRLHLRLTLHTNAAGDAQISPPSPNRCYYTPAALFFDCTRGGIETQLRAFGLSEPRTTIKRIDSQAVGRARIESGRVQSLFFTSGGAA